MPLDQAMGPGHSGWGKSRQRGEQCFKGSPKAQPQLHPEESCWVLVCWRGRGRVFCTSQKSVVGESTINTAAEMCIVGQQSPVGHPTPLHSLVGDPEARAAPGAKILPNPAPSPCQRIWEKPPTPPHFQRPCCVQKQHLPLAICLASPSCSYHHCFLPHTQRG